MEARSKAGKELVNKHFADLNVDEFLSKVQKKGRNLFHQKLKFY